MFASLEGMHNLSDGIKLWIVRAVINAVFCKQLKAQSPSPWTK